MNGQRLDVTQVLSVVAAASAVVLGGLMLIGGVGLAFAIATSTQPALQIASAGILAVAGAVNLWAGPQLWKRKRQALTASAVATGTLLAYFAVIGDVGEPFLLHALYLLVLAALAYRGRSIQATA